MLEKYFAQMQPLVLGYNPDQPRDEKGQFGETGASGEHKDGGGGGKYKSDKEFLDKLAGNPNKMINSFVLRDASKELVDRMHKDGLIIKGPNGVFYTTPKGDYARGALKALKLSLEPFFLALDDGRSIDGTYAGRSSGAGARMGSGHPSVKAALKSGGTAIKNARQANEYGLKYYATDPEARRDFDNARAFAYAVERAFNEMRAYHLSLPLPGLPAKQTLILGSPDQPRDERGRFGETTGEAHPSVTEALRRMDLPGAHVNTAEQAHGQAGTRWDNMSNRERAGFKDSKDFQAQVQKAWSEKQAAAASAPKAAEGKSGEHISFHDGEYKGYTGKIESQIPYQSKGSDKNGPTMRIQIDGFPKPGGWNGQITMPQTTIQKFAHKVQ
jgi:hypothetical protein